MSLTNDEALAQLKALLAVSGALKVITNEHACGAGKHPALAGFDAKKCEAAQKVRPLFDVRHFVLHNVTAIEGPDKKGRVYARTKEGDYCYGEPSAVLARVTEHIRAK
jgi:hypothetical protein